MLLGQRFEAFVLKSPISVMVRAVLERVFHAPRIDALFERTAVRQYTRELLFSTLVALMSEVVLGISRLVRTAYQQSEEKPSVSIASVAQRRRSGGFGRVGPRFGDPIGASHPAAEA
jgi:hypothetical protein